MHRSCWRHVLGVASAVLLATTGVGFLHAERGWSFHLALDLAAGTLTEPSAGFVAEPPARCDGRDPDGLLAYVVEGERVEVRAAAVVTPSFRWTWKGTKARPGYVAAAAHGAGAVVVAVDASGSTDAETLTAFDVATRRKLWTRRTNVYDLRDLAGPYVALATRVGLEVLDARTGKVRGAAPLGPARFLGQCAAGGLRFLRTSAFTAALDDATGAVRWTLSGVVDTVVVAGGSLVLATLEGPGLRVSSIDLATGAVRARWEYKDVLSRVGGDGLAVDLAPLGPAGAMVHIHGWVE